MVRKFLKTDSLGRMHITLGIGLFLAILLVCYGFEYLFGTENEHPFRVAGSVVFWTFSGIHGLVAVVGIHSYFTTELELRHNEEEFHQQGWLSAVLAAVFFLIAAYIAD